MSYYCPYCGGPAALVTGKTICPHRRDLRHLNFWQCAPCDAYVGCHKAGCGYGDGTVPLGRLADAPLRRAKRAVHSALDPLWREGRVSRHRAYALLASELGIRKEECHIGMFDLERCLQAMDAVGKIRHTVVEKVRKLERTP